MRPYRSFTFALAWVLCSTATGALLGSVVVLLHATVPWAGIALWASSGFGVGATQWLLMRDRVDVSFRWWLLATGCGAFAAVCAQFYFALPFSKAGLDFPDLINKFGYHKVLLFSALSVIAAGLALGIPQLVALKDTDIRWRAWLLATLFGYLALWLGNLGLWSMLMEFIGISDRHWPRSTRIVSNFAGYWTAVSLAQALVIAPAVERRTQANPQ
jgi:hypothetical protein